MRTFVRSDGWRSSCVEMSPRRLLLLALRIRVRMCWLINGKSQISNRVLRQGLVSEALMMHRLAPNVEGDRVGKN